MIHKIIIHADDVVRRLGYSDHFVKMYLCMLACYDETKLLIGMKVQNEHSFIHWLFDG